MFYFKYYILELIKFLVIKNSLSFNVLDVKFKRLKSKIYSFSMYTNYTVYISIFIYISIFFLLKIFFLKDNDFSYFLISFYFISTLGFYNWFYYLLNLDSFEINKLFNINFYINIQLNNWVGFWLFLISEILLFGSLFWGLLYMNFNITLLLGNVWDLDVIYFGLNPYILTFFNTWLLIGSGFSMIFIRSILKYIIKQNWYLI
jgi:hypothetical protein